MTLTGCQVIDCVAKKSVSVIETSLAHTRDSIMRVEHDVDDLTTFMRDISGRKVDNVDFKSTLLELKKDFKEDNKALKVDIKWFVGVLLTASTIVISIVVILIRV